MQVYIILLFQIIKLNSSYDLESNTFEHYIKLNNLY